MLFYFTLLFVLLLDQTTKFIVLQKINLDDSINIIPDFLSLSLVKNARGAFGLLSLDKSIFIIVSSAIILGIIWHYQKTLKNKPGNKLLFLSIGMLSGGALGNLIDRIRFGYVIDFIDLHIGTSFRWPVFNIADTGITIGLTIVLLKLFMEKQGSQKSGI